MKKLYIKPLLILGMFLFFITSQAQITNPDFETGDLTGWTGSSGATVSTVVTLGAWTVNPAGTYMAQLSPNGTTPLISGAETNMGLSAGSLMAYNSSVFGTSTNFGTLTQDITLAAGQSITVYWNYVSSDYAPFNDGVFSSFVGPSSEEIKLLAVTANDYGTGVPVTGNYGSTGWLSVTYTAVGAGAYRLGFGAFNYSDYGVHPILLIDDGVGTTIVPGMPTVTTTDITSIDITTATSGGNITSDGGNAISAKGVCWNTTGSPTIADQKTSDGTGSGVFSSSITGLTGSVTYYVKAYATNSIGTSYGEEKSFTTLPPYYPPTLTTTAITSITTISASSGGDITNDGGAPVLSRGVCWNTTGTPIITDDLTSDGIGTGIFASTVTNLNENTTYYVRAYATNIAGTSYGNELSFITLTPEISVSGLAIDIIDGNDTPSVLDDTDFGDVNVGNSNTHIYTITNVGTENVILSGTPVVAISGDAEFEVTAQPSITIIPPAGTTTFEVKFEPTCTLGAKTAAISIVNNDANENPFDFDIQGNSIDDLAPIIPLITDQAVTEGVDCQGILSDFTLGLAVTDNCDILSIVQSPVSGGLYDFDGTIIPVTITATDVNTNVEILTFNVLFEDGLDFEITDILQTDVTNCVVYPELTNGAIVIETTVDSNLLQYSIHPDAWQGYNNHFNGVIPGDYNVLVKNNNGCVKQWPNVITILPPAEIELTTIMVQDANICYGDIESSIQVMATGGNSDLMYSIDGGMSYQTSHIFENLMGGDYQIQIMDDGGCSYIHDEVISIYQPQSMEIENVQIVNVFGCNGNSNGSITINASSDDLVLQYSIDGGNIFSSNPLFENLSAGTYDIVIKGGGCEIAHIGNPVVINEADPIEITSVNMDEIVCDDDEIGIFISAIGGSGLLEYSIDNGENWSSSNDFNIESDIEYNLIVRDNEGCEEVYNDNPISFTSISSPEVSISVTPSATVCSGEFITIVANSDQQNVIYDWSPWFSSSNTLIITKEPGTYLYTVVVTNEDQCEGTAEVEITFDDCTGIEDVEEKDIRVFPNPNNGDFTLEFTNTKLPKAIRLYNTHGALISEKNSIDEINNTNKYQLYNLNAGMYLIEIEYENGVLYKKVTITK